MISRLDQILFSAITRRWDAGKIDGYSKAVQQPEEMHPAVAAAFQALDTKAAGTLTHVSMMIAGLGLIAPMVAKNPIEEALVVFQIMVYLAIALGCLRCLSIFNSRALIGSGEDVKAQVDRELIIRREIYTVCNQLSIGFTAFVFATLPVLWVWQG